MAENTGSPGTPATSPGSPPEPPPARAPAASPGPMLVGRVLHYRNNANSRCEPAIVFDVDDEADGPHVVAYNPVDGWRPFWGVKQDGKKPGAAHFPQDCTGEP